MNYNEAMSFINGYTKTGGRITDLSRAKELMERIGNPEKRLRFVHVAGTNGKGSVVEYISNALIFSGYKTGQFTSPFITHYEDRIRINGREIDRESLCALAEVVSRRVSDSPYSQFEITMAIALLWFEREGCDVVVLETGIGGTLDSTNVIPPPLLSVITSISLDHTALLGDTEEKIAEQKAGIIKTGSAVVASPCNKKEINDVFRRKAADVGAEYLEPDIEDYPLLERSGDGGVLPEYHFRNGDTVYRPAMPGYHVRFNAAQAVEACRYLRKKGFDISEENIRRSVDESAVPARVQLIPGEPPVVVDGAHNPGGIAALSNAVTRNRGDRSRIFAVCGMLAAKDFEECVESLARNIAAHVFTVDGFAPNCVPADELAKLARERGGISAEACTSLGEAVEKAKAMALENGGIVLVCGSLYLASLYLNSYRVK